MALRLVGDLGRRKAAGSNKHIVDLAAAPPGLAWWSGLIFRFGAHHRSRVGPGSSRAASENMRAFAHTTNVCVVIRAVRSEAVLKTVMYLVTRIATFPSKPRLCQHLVRTSYRVDNGVKI